MAPHVRIVLKGGRDFMRPTCEFDVVIAREDAAGIEHWVLWWKEEDGSSRQGAFMNSARALGVMKVLLDETTARWASAVVFEVKASDSHEAKPTSDE